MDIEGGDDDDGVDEEEEQIKQKRRDNALRLREARYCFGA